MDPCELEASLGNRVNFSTARATQRNSSSEKNKNKSILLQRPRQPSHVPKTGGSIHMELTALGCSLTLPSCCKVDRTLEGFKFQELNLVNERKKGMLWHLYRRSIPAAKALDLTVLV